MVAPARLVGPRVGEGEAVLKRRRRPRTPGRLAGGQPLDTYPRSVSSAGIPTTRRRRVGRRHGYMSSKSTPWTATSRGTGGGAPSMAKRAAVFAAGLLALLAGASPA